ncbi:MAG: Rne/Rng family ribonuclease, partial [Actinomycetota bacterium]|nr:Rne/Rng family ribonuclease [Actinomycetota bacterium]
APGDAEPSADALAEAPADVPVDDTVEVAAADAAPDGDDDTAADAASDGDDDTAAPPTRLQARARRSTRGRERSRDRSPAPRGRRPIGGVSEETRRAVTEGPPRRMFVTVGDERTQVAVLEERTLVEHYVTRRQDNSYVGNIYLGRVQNVLPGMEAAFVDIGKGRNGVLYAGEVDYDEADLEQELPRIEQTLKPGQSVLVQVTKDPMGTKGARLTQHLSIAGRYCVLAPGDGMLGISRKLTDEERERLRRVLEDVKPDGYGLIVRTAAEGATREQLAGDVARLQRIWEQVTERAKDGKPLEPVYEEPDLVIRVIRDIFGPEYCELIVDSEQLAAQIRDYLADVSPELVDRVKVHHGDAQIFDAYEITNQIRRALERKVWLRSGGYLIIEKTEAMWVIDVNTGKFVGERNLEETVLKNNIEAAVEIARQLRLRDMGGIIVIDFVDMLVPANRDEVLKRFRRELARDKTKSRVMEISKLGLVQMTRKNVSQGLQESFTTSCDVCDGRGARIVEHIV